MIFRNITVWLIGSVIIGFLVLFFSLVAPFKPDNKYELDKCRWSSEMSAKKVKGLLIRKFVDANNHNKPTLLISGSRASEKVELLTEMTNFYDFVMIGDSLRKESGTLKVDVIRTNATFEKVLSYGCSSGR